MTISAEICPDLNFKGPVLSENEPNAAISDQEKVKEGMYHMNKFEGVANTLFVPLVARIAVSKEFPEYFMDKKSA